MIAALLVHPAVSVTIGLVVLLALWWYWARLGRKDVPVSRRRVRRMTTMLILIVIPLMIAALSFIDRTTHPREFIIAWTLVLLLMLLIMLGAAIDALNSLRLHQRDLDQEAADAAKELAEAVKRRREKARREDEQQ